MAPPTLNLLPASPPAVNPNDKGYWCCTCLRCGYVWLSRLQPRLQPRPRSCALCKSRYWFVSRGQLHRGHPLEPETLRRIEEERALERATTTDEDLRHLMDLEDQAKERLEAKESSQFPATWHRRLSSRFRRHQKPQSKNTP